MDVGMVGLGRMGFKMAVRLLEGGHRVVGHTRDPEKVVRLQEAGAVGAFRLEELVQALPSPRAVWLMLPCGDPVDQAVLSLLDLLEQGDIIIDGGNSYYVDTLNRAEMLQQYGIHLVDVGTGGGVWGREHGYSLAIGGESEIVSHLEPLWRTLAPAQDRGWGHVGPHGAGHFVKMVHNGIEYGMMQAIAEGLTLLRRKESFDFDIPQVARIWQNGSVVRSWLLELTEAYLSENPDLEGVSPVVPDSGEGRWAVMEAVDLDIPAPVITLALQQRLRSRDESCFSDRLLAAMRHAFGGHPVGEED